MSEGKVYLPSETYRNAEVVAFRDPPIFVNGSYHYFASECIIEKADQGACVFAFHCQQCMRDIMPMKNTIPKECPHCYTGGLVSIGTGSWTSRNTFTLD